jgi:hypothetical protein
MLAFIIQVIVEAKITKMDVQIDIVCYMQDYIYIFLFDPSFNLYFFCIRFQLIFVAIENI